METIFDIKNKVILITGSSQGIGFNLARSLGSAGAVIFLNGTKKDKLDNAVKELRDQGINAFGVIFDVADEEEVKNAIALMQEDHPIDVLINNAGIQIRGPLEDFSYDDWNKIISVNLTGAFLVSKYAAGNMIKRKQGKIINICSLQSELARPTIAPYAASKGGLKMLTRSMACEWAKHNIQVNAIAPGYFLTEMTKPLSEDPQFDKWIKERTPSSRWGELDELCGAVIFLASSASSFVNGQVIVVDGGLSAVI